MRWRLLLCCHEHSPHCGTYKCERLLRLKAVQRQIVITYPLATDITFWPTFACHRVIHAEFHLINSPTHLTTHPLMDVAQDSGLTPSGAQNNPPTQHHHQSPPTLPLATTLAQHQQHHQQQ